MRSRSDHNSTQWTSLSGKGCASPPSDWPLSGYRQTAVSPTTTRGLVADPIPSAPLLVFGPYVPSVL